MKKTIGIIAGITLSTTLFCAAAQYLKNAGLYGCVDLIPEKVPLGVITVPAAAAPGINVTKNSKAVIDYSNARDGYVMLKSAGKTSRELRASIIGPRGEAYTYTVNPLGNYEVLPLSEGGGSYQVSLYEKVGGTKYSTLASATFQVTLANEFSPFLRPNQYVNYSSGSETVKKAAEIVGSSSGVIENIAAVYSYVTKSISYDKDLAATVQKGYLSDVDAVIKKGKGICFDYAAVMTAMLRSQQIPSKLVVGYSGSTYHAWINVYSLETGWIEKAVYFDGASWKLMDPTYAANKKTADAKSYKAKFTY